MTTNELVESTALIPSCDVDAVLAKRDAIVLWAEQVETLMAASPDRGFSRIDRTTRRGRTEQWSREGVAKDADRDGWEEIMQRSGLWTFCDHTARELWRKHLDDYTFPPLNAENVESVMLGVHGDRKKMVARGVTDCFRHLSGRYKTNSPMAFGKRMILTRVLEIWGGKAAYASPNHGVADKLDDLIRFLCLLRGVAEPDNRRGAYHTISDGLPPSASRTWPVTIAFDWFEIRCFMNGNGHLTFKHDEDVKRLNRVLAYEGDGKTIPNDRRASW